ncbi:MAG: hypothetical protein U0414_09910 [Polyangiaceae bacterium]
MRVRTIIAALASLLLARRADAICGAPPAVTVTPTLAHAAPVNAHVWVTLPASWRATGFCDAFLADAPCPVDTYSLGVRRAPRLGRERPWIAVTERESPRPRYLPKDALGARTVELAPASVFEPSTLYEVHLRAKGAGTDEVIGVFETGDFTDSVAPAWRGAPTGAYDHAPPTKSGVIRLSECGDPTARFERLDPTDDRTERRDLRFEVRVRDLTEPPNLLRVPDAVMNPFDDGRGGLTLWLGNSDDPSDDGLLPRDQHPVSVSLVIVDWAGNRSDERAFDL